MKYNIIYVITLRALFKPLFPSEYKDENAFERSSEK